MIDKIKENWEKILLILKEEHEVSDVSYRTWLQPLTPYSFKGNTVTIIVPEQTFLAYVKKKYGLLLKVTISEFLDQDCDVDFKVKDQIEEEKQAQAPSLIQKNKAVVSPDVIQSANLNPKYTFDTFVVGSNNNLAHAAALAVAESPGEIYNPLFIYGGVGLGKTHLMMAIGHYILDNNLNTKIVYTTAQQFVEDYFKSKNKNQKSTAISDYFDNYYRSADVLLVDDIQYLADRQGSQDEFFKLFEYLFEKNKQIIVTSDRKASELNIMDRLKSRFTWGMQVDIKKPNQNLRKAILKSKLSTLIANVDDVSNDALDYIATNFEENVRELEGALRRFVNYCVAFNIDYTLENAKLSLESIISSNKISSNEGSSNQAEKVKTIVASYFNIPVKELSGSSRKQEIVYARSIAIYLLRTKYNIGLKKIGEYLGNRDHATVAHAIDKIEDGIKSDEFISQDVSNLVDKLNK